MTETCSELPGASREALQGGESGGLRGWSPVNATTWSILTAWEYAPKLNSAHLDCLHANLVFTYNGCTWFIFESDTQGPAPECMAQCSAHLVDCTAENIFSVNLQVNLVTWQARWRHPRMKQRRKMEHVSALEVSFKQHKATGMQCWNSNLLNRNE